MWLGDLGPQRLVLGPALHVASGTTGTVTREHASVLLTTPWPQLPQEETVVPRKEAQESGPHPCSRACGPTTSELPPSAQVPSGTFPQAAFHPLCRLGLDPACSPLPGDLFLVPNTLLQGLSCPVTTPQHCPVWGPSLHTPVPG